MILVCQALYALPLLGAVLISQTHAVHGHEHHRRIPVAAGDIVVGDYIAQGFDLKRQSSGSTTSDVDESGASTVTLGASDLAITPAPSVSANGTINSAALACYSSRFTWRQSWGQWYNASILPYSWSTTKTNVTSQLATVTTTTIYPFNASTYTLCDGTPRVDASPVTLTSTYNYTVTRSSIITATPTANEPAVPCTVTASECEYLYYNTNISWDDEILLGMCGLPAHIGLPCLIGGGPVRLVYFPVTTEGGNLCAGSGTTLDPSGPSTVSTLGTVFTTGSVYLSFESLFATQEGFGLTIGPTFTNYLLALPSDAVSTQCGGWFSAQGPGTALNWADLNYPYPASAYDCADRCTTERTYGFLSGTEFTRTMEPQCNTIWSDFNPILAVPTQARDLVPEWSTCSFWDVALPNFLFDPPIALEEGTSVAAPTPVGAVTSTTASAAPGGTTYTALPETVAATSPPPFSATQFSQSTSTSSVAAQASSVGPAVAVTFTVGSVVHVASAAHNKQNGWVLDGSTAYVGGTARTISGDHTVSFGLAGIYIDATAVVPYEAAASAGSGSAKAETASSSAESRGSSSSSTRGTTATGSGSSSSKASSGSAATSSATNQVDRNDGAAVRLQLEGCFLAVAVGLLFIL